MLTSILAAALFFFHKQSMNLIYSTSMILYAQTINGHCILLRAVCVHIPNLCLLFTVTTLTQAHLLLVPTCALSIHGEDLVSNLHPLHPSSRHKHSCAAQSHCLHPQALATSRGTQLYLPRLMAIPSVHSLVRGSKQRMGTQRYFVPI